MREIQTIKSALGAGLPPNLVAEIVDTFVGSSTKFNAADYEGALNKAGLFSEHVLRALLYRVTGIVPKEIERFGDALNTLKKSTEEEALSTLIPRILSATAYDLRSKRGAVHVKGVNPQKRDAALAVTAMSWVLAELLSVFGNIAGYHLDSITTSLMRRKSQLVEQIAGRPIVTAKLPVHVETLLIIEGHREGISRREIGRLVKASPSSVTHALSKINKERWAHCESDLWFITGPGEDSLAALFLSYAA